MRARVLTLICAGALVAGCMGTAPVSNPDKAAKPAGVFGFLSPAGQAISPKAKKKPPLAKVSMARGDVVVAGPSGYCIDPQTVQSRPERGFALIASCFILSNGEAGRIVEPVLVSVTVGPRGEAADLPTPGALAQTAKAKLLGGDRSSGLVTAHLASGGDKILPGGDARYWRGAFLQNGRMVGLGLYAPKGSVMAGSEGATLLARVKAQIVHLSPKGNAPAAQSVKKQGNTGLLGGLFKR
ncbi:dihydroxy-acid dehydratase [Tropicibacter naphthalenivorans]|uniref:Dihydroxy-acid dehydratase n=1 Tax=Tropicibacter naphthalenivorans TaxID=441103 RepID=A0A0P1GC80_9RHOB|nr:dihydroxy-acid dehydratase [Tropicibacter naphthalenivorans]CUH79012.1 hypothetical protein TRN7648_02279 [Tropicibacter naphthalenivorans]SMD03921.1 hypothetical protein SAMN04488093_11195 [Tropicibacter naphthalenivorans]